MKTAQQNIAKLPAQCFGVLLLDQSLIKIKAGESGYYPLTTMTPSPEKMMKGEGCKTMSELADKFNAGDGVTKAQRKAMEWGSQFGWESGLADPERYDENGKPRKTASV